MKNLCSKNYDRDHRRLSSAYAQYGLDHSIPLQPLCFTMFGVVATTGFSYSNCNAQFLCGCNHKAGMVTTTRRFGLENFPILACFDPFFNVYLKATFILLKGSNYKGEYTLLGFLFFLFRINLGFVFCIWILGVPFGLETP